MNNQYIGYEFPKWVTGLDLYRIAKRVINGDEKFTVDNFAKGSDALFNVREFYNLRDIFEEHGLLAPVDEKDLLKGFQWSKSGGVFLKMVVEYYAPPHSPA